MIVYTGRDLTRREETRLKKYAETIIVKDVRSPERLLDETALFLHRVESKLPAEKRRMLEQLHSTDEVFKGKRVLIADDDVRNVFALASVLERQGMDVQFAENGNEAIASLEADPAIDLVLMDIMMPELDGYEAMQRIRAGAEVREAADHLADREGDEGRPREVDRERRLRLHHEAGRHRPASLADAGVAVQVGDPQHETPEGRLDLETLELQLLLEGVYRQYGFDFREYARRLAAASRLAARPRRRRWRRSRACSSGVLHDPSVMERLLLDLSINVTSMFRDPTFYVAFREKVVPLLRTYPVHAHLGRRLLDRRGGLLARDHAAPRRASTTARASTRPTSTRRCSRARAKASSRSTGCRSTRTTTSAPAASARSPSTTSPSTRARSSSER